MLKVYTEDILKNCIRDFIEKNPNFSRKELYPLAKQISLMFNEKYKGFVPKARYEKRSKKLKKLSKELSKVIKERNQLKQTLNILRQVTDRRL
jgi:predicted RNase H-like nuclease (RuvC/YqgF family)